MRCMQPTTFFSSYLSLSLFLFSIFPFSVYSLPLWALLFSIFFFEFSSLFLLLHFNCCPFVLIPFSVYLFFFILCMAISLSHLLKYLSICFDISAHPSICSSFCLYVYLSIFPLVRSFSFFLSVRQFVILSACLYIYLSFDLSVHLSVFMPARHFFHLPCLYS